MCLLLSACSQGQSDPPDQDVAPSSSVPVDIEVEFDETLESRQIIGEFGVQNTSGDGLEVLIETLHVVVERRSPESVWLEVIAECVFDPPAPVSFDDDLVVSFACSTDEPIPNGTEVRTTAEVTIEGSDEIYRIAARKG